MLALDHEGTDLDLELLVFLVVRMLVNLVLLI